MKKLLFGTAGIPIRAKGLSTEEGLKTVKALNLDCMEIEFVYGIYMNEASANRLGQLAKSLDLELTAHAPYYINLNAKDESKLKGSKNRISETARIIKLCNGYSITFHPGFYLDSTHEETYRKIKAELMDIVETLKKENNNIWIRPETTGKKSQFGSLKELLKLSQEIEQVMPCIDFSHLHAREGNNNSYEEFKKILEEVEKALGKAALKQMHIHVSGIAYGPKGERNHLNLEDSDFRYKELLKALKEFNASGAVICESPNIEGDAMLLKKTYEAI